MKIIYPNLYAARDLGFFRIGGFGLGNCMFVAARSIILAHKLGWETLRPTWERFGFGTLLRGEKDKRLYVGLFKQESIFKRLRKAWIANFCKHICETKIDAEIKEGCIEVNTVRDFFHSLKGYSKIVREYFLSNINPKALVGVPNNLSDTIAVHIRLGDYPKEWRTDISWYVEIIKRLRKESNHNYAVQVFSDGTDEELKEVLNLPATKRAFYGNAIADIIAMSRCKGLIGSSSTFSCWAGYIGQIPSIFPLGYDVKLYDGVIEDERKICISEKADDKNTIDFLRAVYA